MSRTTLLDGGMGSELSRRLGETDRGWDADAIVTHADLVADLHAEFLEAGADVVTTATYALGRHKLNHAGTPELFAEANRAAARAAETARDRVNPGALVAGSIGPVRLSYQPDLVPPPEVVEREVIEQVLVLAPHVDLFLCETMTLAAEARAAATAARSTGKPVWVGLTLHETGPAVLRSDEPIAVAAHALAGVADAILLNCTSPEAVDAGLPDLAAATDVPVGAYANGYVTIPPGFAPGAEVNHPGRRDDLGPDAYAAHVSRWIDAGASIVGGCCEIGPDHIAKLRELIDRL